MKTIHIETLISKGVFPESSEWRMIREQIASGILAVQWPLGSGSFTIYPQSGKKRGEGNGVKPIKDAMMASLRRAGWQLEAKLDIATVKKPGALDAVTCTPQGYFAVEWETGNISSSHRALNKMALGILHRKLIGGVLVVPSRTMYQYLTDRVGNWAELEPYLDLWKSIPCNEGLLQIVVVEHDATSIHAPRILKGTDGRAMV